MTLTIRVAGGTNAGHRTVPKPPPERWTCKSHHANPGYAATCLHAHCRERRPRG